jgi:uncharacterized lipoprotein YddW (UPF0748 family)
MARLLGKAALTAVLLSALVAGTAGADEFRAFWVDAWGAGFLDQSQVDTLLGVVGDPNSKGRIREANCNAVIVQVRRRADVCYPSAMGEPYFSGLSPSNFNALQAMINAAHDTTGGKQRIEVHGWLVTFATSTSGGTPSPLYYAHNNPADPLNYWVTLNDSGAETDDKALDPGHPKCEEYLTDVCLDLVNNFDIDGIHYDYIRFTANNQGYNPTSVARYNARYGLSGQPAPSDEQWKQWRRDQVTNLVRRVYAKVQATRPSCKVSGAFVTWNPSPTSSTRAAFQATRPYYDVYSDWDAWMQEGIVDMAVPMTYYNYSTYPNDYVRWMNFEKDRKFNRHMVIGPGIYLNSLSNAILELQMTRSASPAGNYANGFTGYSYRVPYSGGTWAGFSPTFVSQVCPEPANIPVMPWKVSPTKGHISGTVTYATSGEWADGATVTITGPENRSMYCDGTGFYAFIDLTPGNYVVTASKTGYPSAQANVQVAIGSVTGNMYVTDLVLGGGGNPPAISNVGASNITNNSATISWTTDQTSTSKVEYGLTTSYGSSTPVDNNLVTSHAMNLSGLSQKMTYHYRVVSGNLNGTTTSGDYTFTTAGPPSISNPQATNITSTSATITWTTDVPSDSRVNYGLTTAYGSQVTDSFQGTSHSLSITGLAPSTLYHYQCVSTNAYGTAQTTDLTFTTAAGTTELVIDNTDAGWSNTSPNGNTWTTGSSGAVPKIGTNYLYSRGDGSLTESSVTRKCRWTPNLATSGYYDVYVYYQIGQNRNSAAPYRVHYYGGEVTSVQNQYSQTPNQGGWFLVAGNVPFTAGSAGYVELTTLSTDTNYVSADAAKWVLVTAADVTPPTMSNVSDEQYTSSTTSLSASWSGYDPDSGVSRYEYAIGTTSGGTNVRGWTNVGTATSATFTGLSLSIGTKYYITVRAVNGSGIASSPMTSSGVTVARAVAGMSQVKTYPDGEVLSLPAASVSAKFTGFFYVQDLDRTSGVRVESTAAVNLNQQVQVYGVLGTVNGERKLSDCKVVVGGAGPAVKPLGIKTGSAGGQTLNVHTPGVQGGVGLYNVGLLVRTVGKVTAVTADGFYIDDGCRLLDGSGNLGLKVWTGASGSATVNTWVKVTGVVSCRTGAGGLIYPQILARDMAVF